MEGGENSIDHFSKKCFTWRALCKLDTLDNIMIIPRFLEIIAKFLIRNATVLRHRAGDFFSLVMF